VKQYFADALSAEQVANLTDVLSTVRAHLQRPTTTERGAA
jgi:hypothetical protein